MSTIVLFLSLLSSAFGQYAQNGFYVPSSVPSSNIGVSTSYSYSPYGYAYQFPQAPYVQQFPQQSYGQYASSYPTYPQQYQVPYLAQAPAVTTTVQGSQTTSPVQSPVIRDSPLDTISPLMQNYAVSQLTPALVSQPAPPSAAITTTVEVQKTRTPPSEPQGHYELYQYGRDGLAAAPKKE